MGQTLQFFTRLRVSPTYSTVYGYLFKFRLKASLARFGMCVGSHTAARWLVQTLRRLYALPPTPCHFVSALTSHSPSHSQKCLNRYDHGRHQRRPALLYLLCGCAAIVLCNCWLQWIFVGGMRHFPVARFSTVMGVGCLSRISCCFSSPANKQLHCQLKQLLRIVSLRLDFIGGRLQRCHSII